MGGWAALHGRKVGQDTQVCSELPHVHVQGSACTCMKRMHAQAQEELHLTWGKQRYPAAIEAGQGQNRVFLSSCRHTCLKHASQQLQTCFTGRKQTTWKAAWRHQTHPPASKAHSINPLSPVDGHVEPERYHGLCRVSSGQSHVQPACEDGVSQALHVGFAPCPLAMNSDRSPKKQGAEVLGPSTSPTSCLLLSRRRCLLNNCDVDMEEVQPSCRAFQRVTTASTLMAWWATRDSVCRYPGHHE